MCFELGAHYCVSLQCNWIENCGLISFIVQPVHKMDQQRHIPLDKWLSSLGLMQYAQLFQPYTGVQSILHMTENDLKNLGIKTGSHRARMASSLHLLKEKRGLNKATKLHSLAFPNGRARSFGADGVKQSGDDGSVTYEPLLGSMSSPEVASDSHLHNQSIISKNLWYHGPIPRTKAEALVKDNGDFLVRDSISKKGDYVLTCWWNGSALHFMVNRQILKDKDMVKVQYQFEQELCDTVPQLINLYVRGRKFVSEASGAIISQPINRRISADSLLSNQNTDNTNPVKFPFRSLQKCGSQPLLSLADSTSSLDDIQKPDCGPSSDQIVLPKSRDCEQEAGANLPPVRDNRSAQNTSSEGHLTSPNTMQEVAKHKGAPPKPSRIPTFKLQSSQRPKVTVKNKKLYDDEKDYTDYSTVKSWPRDLQRTHESASMLTDFYCTSRTDNLSAEKLYPENTEQKNHTYDVTAVTWPDMHSPSKFASYDYNSNILTSNNKPLEKSALSVLLPLLLETDVKTLAMHLTLLDLDLLKVIGNHDLCLGVKSGLELITLPQGAQLRRDALERFHCLKYFVATSVLLCLQYPQRSRIIHQWIQIANEAKTALGNLYGFAYIMEGLQTAQVVRLKNTWIATHHHHQYSKQLYDTRLRTTYRSMVDADSALPLHNVTLPYIIPIIQLMEPQHNHISTASLGQTALQTGDLNVVLAHLDIARIICAQHGFYKVTSEHMIGSFRPLRDLLELFDTRMHLRFLWGAKGASVSPLDRYSKFEEVLNVLSENCEPRQTSVKESSL